MNPKIIVAVVVYTIFVVLIARMPSLNSDAFSVFTQNLVPLQHILNKHHSDKCEHHGYQRYYDTLLAPYRNKPVRFVEIGVEKGGSVRAWREYFTSSANIFGIGYGNFQIRKTEPCDASNQTRIRTARGQTCQIYRGDQSDRKFLRYFVKATGGNFDVLIDDGSHVPSHQLISFEVLWPHIKPGGYYVIEDVETSYWEKYSKIYGYPLEHEGSIVYHFKKVIDAINREYQCGKNGIDKLYHDIEMVSFGQNVIILKKALSEDMYYLEREYRFPARAGCSEPKDYDLDYHLPEQQVSKWSEDEDW